VIKNGGQIYHRTAITPTEKQSPDVVVGPLRVLPGRLSVCRTFGDYEAKLPDRAGNPKVVIAIPEIKSFEISKQHDFIFMGCDGIFDKMNNSDTIKAVWNCSKKENIHAQAMEGVESVIKNSLLRKTLDNVTGVLISFAGYKHRIFGK
jgi:protein phosphatase 2C family protein 2/3